MSTKDQLLIHLKEGKGTWVSGEFLGGKMAISRSAIWKHISALKDDGYVIESSRKKGYLLRRTTDSLNPNEIQYGLNTEIFGKRDIFYFRDTDSTNVRAEDSANEGAPEGAIVVAETQSLGRGRRGRSWFSPPGDGIYVSIILRPRLSPNEAPKLTLMASVAAAETLLSLTPTSVNIKWPNDILIGGRKVAGILTEISADMDRIHYVIVGLGVNVNIPAESFPPEIRDSATSIFMETGRGYSRIRILQSYLESFEAHYETFNTEGFEPVMNRWRQLTDVMGKRITVDLINRTYTGVVLDVDDDGFLILQDNKGALMKIVSGDVTLLNEVKIQ